MKIFRSYKFRIYPNSTQIQAIDRTFGCCRFLWNKMLDERINAYHKFHHHREKLYSHKFLTEKQYKIEYPFLKEVDSKALQSTTRNLMIAFKNFFNGLKKNRRIGLPNYKTRKRNQSFTTFNINENIKVDFESKKSKFLISTQTKMINPRFYRNEEKKLRRLHRSLSYKKIGSANRIKAKIKLARKYEKICNRKKDWVHKISSELSSKYDVIILEDLNIAGMQQFNSGLSKSVTLDFSWRQFVTVLKYKMTEQGKSLILIDKWFPSSKLCSN